MFEGVSGDKITWPRVITSSIQETAPVCAALVLAHVDWWVSEQSFTCFDSKNLKILQNIIQNAM